MPTSRRTNDCDAVSFNAEARSLGTQKSDGALNVMNVCRKGRLGRQAIIDTRDYIAVIHKGQNGAVLLLPATPTTPVDVMATMI